MRRKDHSDNFDGSGTTEWPDYIIHFEQCDDWNQWNNLQKAQMLSIHLKGETQKLLCYLTGAQRNVYEKGKSILTDRYDPKEKQVTYRFHFRNSRHEKGVTVSDFEYNLRKLSQKAYPDLTLDRLEVHVIEQFINELGHRELQKHVQFGHPRTLNEVIGLATEFEALVYYTYCKRNKNSFEECWSRRSPRRRGGNLKRTDTGSKSTYVITFQTFKRSKRVPSITITPPDTSSNANADTVEQDVGTPESISSYNPMQTEDSNESHSSKNTFEKN